MPKTRTQLTVSDVKHIAVLANLTLSAELLSTVPAQLSAIIELVNKLQEVDTTTVAPTSQVTGMTNVFREDEVEPSLTQEEALSSAPRSHNGYFVVDAIFENE
jgi:aspartyl-tRNA(Asn)/glutamyl-tRNA(Gln) amidotransferase subunit C